MRKALACMSFAALGLSTAATAQDFTFTVPVRIERMQNIERAWVNCSVVVTTPTMTSMSAPPVYVPLRDGSYTGTITVNLDMASGYVPSDASRWGCSLVYNWRAADGTVFNRSLFESEDRNALYTRDTGQEVVSSQLLAGGPITR